MLNGLLRAGAGFASGTTALDRFGFGAGCGAGCFGAAALKSVVWRARSSGRADDHDATSLRNWSFIAFASASGLSWSSTGVMLIDAFLHYRGTDADLSGAGAANDATSLPSNF